MRGYSLKMRQMEGKKIEKKRTEKRVSAYKFFFRLVLEGINERYPGRSVMLTQVSSLCAKNWRNLDEQTKKNFQDGADAVNGVKCLPTPGTLRNIKNKEERKVKAKGIGPKQGPKRPVSAFVLYCKDHRQRVKKENPNMSFQSITRALAAMWANLDKETKSVYQEMSRKEQERYRKELKASSKEASSCASSLP